MRRIRHENTQPAKSGLLRKEVKRVASTPTQGETISPLPSKELEESSLRYCLLYGTEAVYYEAFNLRATLKETCNGIRSIVTMSHEPPSGVKQFEHQYVIWSTQN